MRGVGPFSKGPRQREHWPHSASFPKAVRVSLFRTGLPTAVSCETVSRDNDKCSWELKSLRPPEPPASAGERAPLLSHLALWDSVKTPQDLFPAFSLLLSGSGPDARPSTELFWSHPDELATTLSLCLIQYSHHPNVSHFTFL